MQTTKFSELQVSDYILDAVKEMGFEDMTPIQAQAIPAVMSGRDVIGQAQTGTGKTAAFGIPAVEHVDASLKATQVLIMCPTRELALQVKEQITKLAKFKKGLLVTAIYGGESYEKQFANLKRGTQIVVGTPGRITDHINRGTLKLDNISMVTLDEADEMLNMGFREDIEKILEFAPVERQTVLFSATMSREILAITKRFQKDPEIIKVTRKEITNDNIEQAYFTVRREAKVEVMCRLIDVNDLKLMLVFCNTKSKVDEVVVDLQERGYAAEGLHGDLRQAARNQVMNKFRTGNTTILVATDVAARGIDVSGVDAVFNYDVPMDLEYYVHRIGRTGRAGQLGKAFMFVSARERGKLRELENYTKVVIPQGTIPTYKDLVKVRENRLLDKVKENVSDENVGNFNSIIEQLLEDGLTFEQITAALLAMQLGPIKPKMRDEELAEVGRNDRGRERDPRGGRNEFRGGRDSRGGDRDRDRGGFRERSGGDRERGSFERRGEHRGASSRGNGVGSGEPGMVRLFLSLGRKDNVAPNHIVGAIASEAKIPGKAIGQIDMYDKFSFVEVSEKDVNKVISGMKGKTINAREASIEVAK
jgi:ATP-dependent RNA helicase DeaD